MPITKNPILRGFNPDPSIIRVEEDYFIATSTFEWFPGVQIHYSKDLNQLETNWSSIDRKVSIRYARQPRFLRRMGSLLILF